MEPYGNGDHGSGVVAFQIGRSHIDVRFRNGSVYRYTAASVGQGNLDRMVALACAGQGLSGFISRTVSDRFAARLE